MSSENDLIFPFNDFMDMIDENPYLVVEFSKMISEELDKTNTLSSEDEKKVKTPTKKKN